VHSPSRPPQGAQREIMRFKRRITYYGN